MPHHHLQCICKKRKDIKHILSNNFDGKDSAGALENQATRSNFSVTKILLPSHS